MEFLNNCCQPVELKEVSLLLLMYADDMVIFSDTIKGLQDMLNTLYCYTEKWKVCANINKTKIVVLWLKSMLRSKEEKLCLHCLET
jgi:hypothetical protein